MLALAGLSFSQACNAGAPRAVSAFTTLHGYAGPDRASSARSLGAINSSQQISLVIALKPRNEAQLKALIRAEHDPASPSFGRYLSAQQFTDQFAPAAADYEAVAQHFEKSGLTVSRRSNRMLVHVTGTAASIGNALRIGFNRYSGAQGEYFTAAQDPQLPSTIAPHVAALVGLRNKVRLKSNARILKQGMRTKSHDATGPGGGFSPQDIAKAYNIPTSISGGAGETIALYELDGYDRKDIAAYAKTFGLHGLLLQNVLVDGFSGHPEDPLNGQIEVTLDIELVQALAPKAKKVMVYEAENDWVSSLDLLNRIVLDNEANEISSSWGVGEDVVANSVPGGVDYLLAENYLLEEAAVQGQAFFCSSGDNGAYEDFFASNPTVGDPASQPYAIGVGGTSLTTNAAGGWLAENTWANEYGATGGGFSQFWPISGIQSRSVNVASGASKRFRNVPDVALNADPTTGYSILQKNIAELTENGDGWLVEGGTSAAAPLWAAFLANVNSARVSGGGKRLGWPAPALYALNNAAQYSMSFHDINDLGNNYFYPTVKGYDLTTGLGTINGLGLFSNLYYTNPWQAKPIKEPTTPSLEAFGGDAHDYLQWAAVPNAKTYHIYRLNAGVDPGLKELATVATTQWVDRVVKNDNVYQYAVSAEGPWGVSDASTLEIAAPVKIEFLTDPEVSATGVTIALIDWFTSCYSIGTLTWGYTPTTMTNVVRTPFSNPGNVTLADLKPGAKVYYSVSVTGGNGTLRSPVKSFQLEKP